MPLTANHDQLGRLDATALDDSGWAAVHQPRQPLTCRECKAPMSARLSRSGLRHFFHRSRPTDCRVGSEGPLHMFGKRQVINAVRSLLGWTAEPEVIGEGWRADVLSTGPDGRRIAWEVQVSSISDDAATERTRRHGASGVETVWLDVRQRSALQPHPHMLVNADLEQPWTVNVYKYVHYDTQRFAGVHEWKWDSKTAPLANVVIGICHNKVVLAHDGRMTTTTADVKTERDYRERLRIEHERRREAADADRERQRIEHERRHGAADADRERQRIERKPHFRVEDADQHRLYVAQTRWVKDALRRYGIVRNNTAAIDEIGRKAGARGRIWASDLAYILMTSGHYGCVMSSHDDAIECALDHARREQQTLGKREIMRRYLRRQVAST